MKSNENDETINSNQVMNIIGLHTLTKVQAYAQDAVVSSFDSVFLGATGRSGKFLLSLASVIALYSKSSSTKTLVLFPNSNVLDSKI